VNTTSKAALLGLRLCRSFGHARLHGVNLVRLHFLPDTLIHHALAIDCVLPLKCVRHYLDTDVPGVAGHVHHIDKLRVEPVANLRLKRIV